MNKIPLTVVGAEKLRINLSKAVERPAVIQAIASRRVPRATCQKNAEYDAAKEKQAIEGRTSRASSRIPDH